MSDHEAEFKQIIRTIIYDDSTVATLPCPDQYVGTAVYQGSEQGFKYEGQPGAGLFTQRLDLPEHLNQSTGPRLIIILESPHKDEFNKLTKAPIGPANGKTGENIHSFLAYATKGLDVRHIPDRQPFDLILMNAVQHQCSLGKSPQKYRTEVFMKCWDNPLIGKRYFVKRLRDYTKDCKAVVINSCTASIRDPVDEAISDTIKDSNYFRLCHPSSPWWASGKTWAPKKRKKASEP
ncbi:hypothetical protein [Methylobacter sp. BBA5.1]|uniref:hypothetical protein n=1 Tax=Methylobacter sp. BBA5.1 TaxID=1495064 RepID=UPI00055BBC91|nr:hypothetical protein [Methylobacter sp. BBA5.1]